MSKFVELRFDGDDDDAAIRYSDPLDRFDAQTDGNSYEGDEDDDDWHHEDYEDDDYDDRMDGDFDSGMASAGFGTDEDYGSYDDDCDCMDEW